MEKPATGFTTVNGDPKHSHAFHIDSFGNGATTGLIGGGIAHVHHIIQKKVKPGGMDNHTHTLIFDKTGSHKPKEADPIG